ncbi:MAG: magnesium transporter [Firmicutes bacterium]|nr:magnesium transporter [Bacillota bacterium]
MKQTKKQAVLSNFQEQILALIEDKDVRTLKSLLAEAEEMEVLYVIQSEFTRKEKALIFRLLTKDNARRVFEQLDTGLQRELLESFTDKYAAEVIEELDPDDRVNLLEELPASFAKKLMGMLSPEERRVTNLLLGYAEDTAGRIMTPKFITLRRDMDVDTALAKIRRQAQDKETIYALYVTDEHKRLQGVLTLKELLIAPQGVKIGDIMCEAVIKVETDSNRREVAKALKDFDLLAIPVVDREGLIVGIVTIDDAVDILEEEATDHIYDKAGLANFTGSETSRSEVLVNGSLWAIWKVRMPFLIITLVAGLASGLIIDGFEETLQAIAVVAVFIPIIMDMGGNVGTQSTTVFVRGMVLGQIQAKKFWKHLGKEFTVGLSIGVIVGTVTGVIAWVWQGMPMLGLAVGLALVTTSTLASMLGFIVPFVLMKLKFDSAAGSSPLITSIKDMVGLTVYFVLVTTLMSNMM